MYSPKLNFNMRNSNEIGELAKHLKSDLAGDKITNVIELLATNHNSSLISIKPKLIPILEEDIDEKLDDLIRTATENGSIPVILISEIDNFDPIKLKKIY